MPCNLLEEVGKKFHVSSSPMSPFFAFVFRIIHQAFLRLRPTSLVFRICTSATQNFEQLDYSD